MKLKKVRLMYGKTQQEVATAVGITQFTYSNYENEKTQPDFSLLVKLADYFHVTVDELLGHEVPYTLNRVQFSEKQLELVERIKSLNDNQCTRVDDFITGVLEAQKVRENTLQRLNKI